MEDKDDPLDVLSGLVEVEYNQLKEASENLDLNSSAGGNIDNNTRSLVSNIATYQCTFARLLYRNSITH